MSLIVTTEPAIEPISVANMKKWLKVDSEVTLDDTLIGSLIKSARIFCENYTSRKLIEQKVDFYCDGLPKGHSEKWWDGVREGALVSLESTKNYIIIPVAPIESVVVFKSYNTSNTESTFPSASYYTDYLSSPPRILLNSGYSWPSDLRAINSIKISLTAGYGDEVTDVPESLVTAIRHLVAYWYENRGDGSPLVSVPNAVYPILEPFCLFGGI